MKKQERKTIRHRRIKKKTVSIVLTNLILAFAVVVFLVAGIRLIQIGKGYLDGRSEYNNIKNLVVKYEEKEKFRIDFEKLLEVNDDTIGWIRFYPQPSIINYPLVQGDDNELYLKKTFSSKENTLGTIFLDVNCSSDFSNKHSIIYGHRMKDGSMFRKLEAYKEKSFWEENPYFYIYTSDGKEITYHIYSVGVVDCTSETYTLLFDNDTSFQSFIDYTINTADYETGIRVNTDSEIVTLSTCTASSDEHRFVVHGVKIKEVKLED